MPIMKLIMPFKDKILLRNGVITVTKATEKLAAASEFTICSVYIVMNMPVHINPINTTDHSK